MKLNLLTALLLVPLATPHAADLRTVRKPSLRGDLIYYETDGHSISDERNPVNAAHPDWLIRSWWW